MMDIYFIIPNKDLPIFYNLQFMKLILKFIICIILFIIYNSLVFWILYFVELCLQFSNIAEYIYRYCILQCWLFIYICHNYLEWEKRSSVLTCIIVSITWIIFLIFSLIHPEWFVHLRFWLGLTPPQIYDLYIFLSVVPFNIIGITLYYIVATCYNRINRF